MRPPAHLAGADARHQLQSLRARPEILAPTSIGHVEQAFSFYSVDLASAICLRKTGSETGFLAQNVDRLLDRDFQGRISDRKAEQVFKAETGSKTVFLNRTGCPVLLENLS